MKDASFDLQHEFGKRMVRWSKGKRQGPIKIVLYPTNRCNLRCRFHWKKDEQCVNNNDEVSKKRYLELIEEGYRLGAKKIEIAGGGEPLCRGDTVDIMERIKKYDMYGELMTNVTLFSSEIIKRLIKINWDRITISIHGPNAKINDYLMGRTGAFEMSVKAIKKFIYWKKKLNKDKPLWRLNVVLCNKNYNKLDGMIELAHRLKCIGVSIQVMASLTKSVEKLKLNEKELRELPIHLKKAKKLADKYGMFTDADNYIESNVVKKADKMNEVIESEIKPIKNKFLSLPCFEPWYTMLIIHDGSVGPCSMFGIENVVNVKNMNLEEIWYGDYFNEIRRNLLNKKLFSFCKNCCGVIIQQNKLLRKELMMKIRDI